MNIMAQIAIPDHVDPDHVVDFDFYNDPRLRPMFTKG